MNKTKIQNQINDLEKKLAELKEKLNKPEEKVFKPDDGDIYYCITTTGESASCTWRNDIIDNMRYNIGNCFKTREEADFEIERRIVVTELKRFAEEHNESMRWDDPTKRKWSICVNAFNGNFDFTSTVVFKYGEVYFSSKEIAQQAVQEIGEDRIKKYYLRVDD